MSFCDLCNEHTRYTTKRLATRDLHLVNLPNDYIKKLTDDELLKLYEWNQNGMRVCGACMTECRDPTSKDCSGVHKSKQAQELYKYRIMVDERTLKQIENEVARRTESRRALRQAGMLR